MTKRSVMIEIHTRRYAVGQSLFDEGVGDVEEIEQTAQEWEKGAEPEELEVLTEGRLVTSPERVELIYDEGELSGMEGSVTSIGFDRSASGLVSMFRTGLVSTALIFEKGKRHICLYNTPFSEFEICVYALQVENRLLTDGVLVLDYLIEVHGAQAERCKMTVSMRAAQDTEAFL